jgi:hypothetical protein
MEKRNWGPVGSSWVWEGEATRRGADTRARQHSAIRFGFKPIQTESNLFQTDSNLIMVY